MRREVLLAIACVGCLALLKTPTARAEVVLTGDSINVKYCLPDQATTWENISTATIPATFVYGLQRYGEEDCRVIVSDASIVVDWSQGHWSPDVFSQYQFSGFVLSDLTNTPITSVTIDPATNLVGLDISRIGFDASHISVNLQGLTAYQTTYVQLNLNTLPEPSTVCLLALGGLALLRRRKAN